jgi:L-histidine Nalpha-methyltransferase
LKIEAIVGRYEFGLKQILQANGSSNCIMWLGSSIGNLTRKEAADFLRNIRQNIHGDDCLLLGMDLRKDADILEPAYDDKKGVTAAFNLNLLDRINGELGGQFKLDDFRHKAIYNVEEGRIEMYLVSEKDHEVHIDHFEKTIRFKENENILTEYSYKYSQSEIVDLAEASGFYLDKQWLDDSGWFSLNCFKPKDLTPA